MYSLFLIVGALQIYKMATSYKRKYFPYRMSRFSSAPAQPKARKKQNRKVVPKPKGTGEAHSEGKNTNDSQHDASEIVIIPENGKDQL